MKVPLLDLKAHHAPLRKEIDAAIASVIDTGGFILGPQTTGLEAEVAAYCGANFAWGVSSGTDALLLALMALGIGPGDEVITSPYTFFATAGAIARTGAKPVFVDILPDSFNIDPARIEAAITKNTKAIMPVHLYGQCADMYPILEIAQTHKLLVIEDAAQAIGARYKGGESAGTMGNIGCLSFFPSKNLGALGDAGMVLTQDNLASEVLRVMRVHGGEPKYYHKVIGGNFRIDALQAAVLRVKLKRLDAWTRARRENAERYRFLLEQSGLARKAGLTLPAESWPDGKFTHIYNQFVIRAPKRDALREALKKEEVDTEIYYPLPLHLQECFAFLGHKAGDFPESEKAAAETVALPIYPELSAKQQAHVVASIAKFYGV